MADQRQPAVTKPTPSAAARAAAEKLVARFRKRMFEPHAPKTPKTSETPKAPRAEQSARIDPSAPQPARRDVGFQASLAEFLLINRLRARRKAVPSADVLERGARILQVTCKHWFAPGKSPVSGSPRTRL